MRSVGWLLAERALRLLIGVTINIITARHLAPEQFGEYSFALSLVSLFSILVGLGLDNEVIKRVVSQPNLAVNILGTSFFLKLIGAIILLPLLYSISGVFKFSERQTVLLLLFGTMYLWHPLQVIDYYLQSRVLSKYFAISSLVSLVIGSIIRLALIFLNANVIWFALAMVIDAAVINLLLLYVYLITLNESIKHWVFDFRLGLSILKSALPVALATLGFTLNLRLDQVMIGGMLGESEVGQYAAGIKLSELINTVPMVLLVVYFPRLVTLSKSNANKFRTQIVRLYSLLIWFGFVINVFTYSFGGKLVELLYGKEFAPANNVFQICMLAAPFVFLGMASNNYLIAKELQKFLAAKSLFGLTINVILNLTLIPNFGMQGAAWATFVSSFFSNIFFDLIWKSTRDNFSLKLRAFNPCEAFRFFERS